MGRWVKIDRRYNQPYRLTGYAVRAIFKWTGLVLAWAFVNSVLTAAHLGVLILASTAGLVWYAAHCVRRNQRPRLGEAPYRLAVPTSVQGWQSVPTSGPWQQPALMSGQWWQSKPTSARWWQSAPLSGQWGLNTPPNWPPPPPGWSPEPGWQPDPSWPPPPPGWQLWIPLEAPTRGAPGERNSRVIPQDVKIAVTLRDQGKCVQCGATEDLHFDHKVPWSRGGTNTVNNIQLLCGGCNRRKGAADSPL